MYYVVCACTKNKRITFTYENSKHAIRIYFFLSSVFIYLSYDGHITNINTTNSIMFFQLIPFMHNIESLIDFQLVLTITSCYINETPTQHRSSKYFFIICFYISNCLMAHVFFFFFLSKESEVISIGNQFFESCFFLNFF